MKRSQKEVSMGEQERNLENGGFTPINVEIPDAPVDTFMGRRKRLQLDASEVGDAATLASLASLGAERLDWSRSATGDTTDE